VIVSRAAFLRIFGTAVVGTSLPRWSFVRPNADGPSRQTPPGSLAAQYRQHVGTAFTIEEVSQRVRLTRVVEAPLHAHIEQFSLLFAGPVGDAIEPGTYTLTHAALGRLEMFITAVGAPAAAPLYQACFSRYVQSKDFPCPINS
jgi:hypothetical protein